MKIYTWIKRNQVSPFYWNADINEIAVYCNCKYKEIKDLILKNDKDALSIRFGVDETGLVYFWNGSINHTGVCNALNKFWILTGIYKFDDTIYTSNNRYSQKQLEKEAKTIEFINAFSQLLEFNENVHTLKLATSEIIF